MRANKVLNVLQISGNALLFHEDLIKEKNLST